MWSVLPYNWELRGVRSSLVPAPVLVKFVGKSHYIVILFFAAQACSMNTVYFFKEEFSIKASENAIYGIPSVSCKRRHNVRKMIKIDSFKAQLIFLSCWMEPLLCCKLLYVFFFFWCRMWGSENLVHSFRMKFGTKNFNCPKQIYKNYICSSISLFEV